MHQLVEPPINEVAIKSFESLQHAMVISVMAICSMMFVGFGALITLFATHF